MSRKFIQIGVVISSISLAVGMIFYHKDTIAYINERFGKVTASSSDRQLLSGSKSYSFASLTPCGSSVGDTSILSAINHDPVIPEKIEGHIIVIESVFDPPEFTTSTIWSHPLRIHISAITPSPEVYFSLPDPETALRLSFISSPPANNGVHYPLYGRIQLPDGFQSLFLQELVPECP